MEIKQQSNEKVTTNAVSKNKNKTKQKPKKTQQTDEDSKTQEKPTGCNRMVTLDTVKKSS